MEFFEKFLLFDFNYQMKNVSSGSYFLSVKYNFSKIYYNIESMRRPMSHTFYISIERRCIKDE